MKTFRTVIIRRHRRNAASGGKSLKALGVLGLLVMAGILAALVAAGLRYAIFSREFPSLARFREHYEARPEPTQVFARDGETLLFTLAYENFESQDLRICGSDGEGCFPVHFVEAVRLTHGSGSNTIAEEMVRTVYGDTIAASSQPERMIRALSRQVLQTFGEDQLLEWYFNRAWFGQMAFGLDAAARLYLDKPGDQLNDAECVLLSAIISSPMLNPIDSNGAVRDSYLNQLSALHRAGLFTDEESEQLSRSNFTIFEPPRYIDGRDPDIITRKALDSAVRQYGRMAVERGGLRIITSEDVSLQDYLFCVTSSSDYDTRAAACPLSSSFDEETLRTATEALRSAPVSIAILDVSSGQLLAALEGERNEEGLRSYAASQSAFPVGTLMNYFAALTAFSGGSSPSTLLWDLENTYDPQELAEVNDPEPFAGPIQLRTALSQDNQRALAAHLQAFGTGAVQRNAVLFGLSGSQMLTDTEILTNGGSDTSEAMAFALIPFAGSGTQTGTNVSGAMHPITILRIEFSDGSTEDPQPFFRKALIADDLAYLVHSVFVQESGEMTLSDRPAAVKSGKAVGDEGRWISGYTTQISCAIRLGDPQILSSFVTDTDQVQTAAEVLWISVMEAANRGRTPSGWETPSGISRVRVCLPSGKLPTAACRETSTEVFLRGNEPYEYDEYYVEAAINRQNRMLATRFTPAADIVTEVFLNLPENAAEWAAANGIEAMPNEYDPIREETRSPGIRIESPADFQTFITAGKEKIDVIIRLTFSQQPLSHQVSLGHGMFPTSWQEVCSGGALENGRWLLCSIDTAALEPGLYALRTAFTLPGQRYHAAETYFIVE